MASEISLDENYDDQNGKPLMRKIMNVCKTLFLRLLARKPMHQLQADIETQTGLRRSLNWVQLIAIGVAGMIGAGIFVLSGQAAAENAGPSVIISYIITGFIALLAALSFSELAAMMSVSGAAYTYTYAALGEYAAWFIGWNYALLYQLGASAVVLNWSRHVVRFIEYISDYQVVDSIVEAPIAWNGTSNSFYSTGQIINLPAIAITFAVTIVLLSGIRLTGIITLVLVTIKVIIILIIIFASSKYVNRENYKPFFPSNKGSFGEFGFTGMLQACTTVFFAYIGFDSVAAVAQEAKTPTAKTVPIGLISSVVISCLFYIDMSTVMVGLVQYNQLDLSAPLLTALAQTPYGKWIHILVYLGAITALTTVAISVLLAQIRIFYAMALDGLLPEFFATRHRTTQIPWISTIISGSFCAVISAFLPADLADEMSSIAALITFIFVHINVTVMHYTHPDMQRTFKVPFGPWLIPVLGSLLCILLMKGIQKNVGFAFLVWTGIGQIIYFIYGYWHSKRRYKPKRDESIRSTHILLPTIENIVFTRMHTPSQPDEHNEVTDTGVNDMMEYL